MPTPSCLVTRPNGSICTISHPLNRTPWKPGQPRVYKGYGLIQPRVGMSLPGAHRSTFARLYSTGTGVDPYAMAVSDTYQDLFGEGSFTGKGIFEVDVFSGVLEKRFRENSLLSHDLVEGAFLRTGLASDIEVIDDYPANYLSSMKRMHRWVRGDWQTIVWLFPGVRDEDGVLRPNPLSALNRWKILDNLRRSLVGPPTILMFTLGWLLFPIAGAWLDAVLPAHRVLPGVLLPRPVADVPAALSDALDFGARYPRRSRRGQPPRHPHSVAAAP